MNLPLVVRWFGQPISTGPAAEYLTYAEAVELIDQEWVDCDDRPVTGEVVRRVSGAGVPFLDMFWEHTE